MAVIVKGVTSSGGGTKIASMLNDDGTQSLIISDKDSVIDLTPLDNEIDEQTDLIAQIQAELDAKAEGGGGAPRGEIEINENGVHDVAQYATANVNVQSEPVLLWTNASPTSKFGAQTVSVNGAGYDAYLIETSTKYANPPTCICYIRKNYSYTQYFYTINSSGYTGIRTVSSATDTEITFGVGGNGYNEYGVPLHIWGVKFTLN